MKNILLAITLLVFANSIANAVDLHRVKRTIGSQPEYTASEQAYALLVFGENADPVWSVFDGDTLFVDRNCDGDLTDPQEAVKPTKIDDEVSIYKVGSVGADNGYELLVMRIPDQLVFIAGLPGKRTQVADSVEVSKSSEESPIVHFGGELTVAAVDGGLDVPLGERARLPLPLRRGFERDFYVQIGTPGVGKGSFASLAYIETSFDDFCQIMERQSMKIPPMLIPEEASPQVDIEFVSADHPEVPIRKTYFLKERC